MKRSTLALVITTVVSLALSVIFGVIAGIVLLGEAGRAAKDIDFRAEFNKVRAWFSGEEDKDNKENNAKVSISSDDVHVVTDDGKTVDVGYDGVKVN